MTGGSSQFAVIRKTRAPNWIYLDCQTNDNNCGHFEVAGAAAERAADGIPDTHSDTEECSTDEEVGA